VSDTIELAKDDLAGTAAQNTGVYVCTELVDGNVLLDSPLLLLLLLLLMREQRQLELCDLFLCRTFGLDSAGTRPRPNQKGVRPRNTRTRKDPEDNGTLRDRAT